MATQVGKLSYTNLYISFLVFIVVTSVVFFTISSDAAQSISHFWYLLFFSFLLSLWVYLSTQKMLQQKQKLKESQDAIFHQLECSQQLFQYIKPKLPLPNTRNWVASPDFILTVFNEILQKQPKQIVELGSGVSSLYLGYLLKQHQINGNILSIDHDTHYAEKTNRMLEQHQLEDYVSVEVAPLSNDWYTKDAIVVPENIDILIVDGPPTFKNPKARNPAFETFKPYLSENALIICDDSKRNEGKNMYEKWLASDPRLKLKEYVYTEKGTAILEYQA